MAWLQLGIAAVLRLAWLARPGPYGGEMVGKIDWYLGHAIAYDCLQAGIVVLPGVVVAAVATRLPRVEGMADRVALTVSRVLLMVVTVVAVVDQELMRFVGTHLSRDLLGTYANPASIRQLPTMLSEDAGGPYLGVALLIGACAVFWWRSAKMMDEGPLAEGPVEPTAKLATNRRAKLRANAAPQRLVTWPVTWPVTWLAMMLVSYVFVTYIWPGSFRAWRLQTPVALLKNELSGRNFKQITPAMREKGVTEHQRRYAAKLPRGARTHFVSSRFPLLHVGDHGQCQWLQRQAAQRKQSTNIGSVPPLSPPRPLPPRCNEDRDNDGFTLLTDCDDTNATIHPRAVDIPRDGIDQNCDGIDAQPPNILLLILETHRALHTGHLFAETATDLERKNPAKTPQNQPISATPALDKLAAEGLSFRRSTANGAPTIIAFMAIHTGLLPQSRRAVATHFTQTRLHSLPQILHRKGYQTHFFSAADPAWDHQNFWLARWYDSTDYHRSRETDAALFSHLGDWFGGRLPGNKLAAGKPWFVAAMTRSNHYPFHRIDGVARTGGDSLSERMTDTMRYTDQEMAKLLRTMGADGLLDNTVVIITGDHGFPFGEHGITKLWATAHIEATGVPLVLWGDHVRLRQRGRGTVDSIASHIDIVPTVLDLIGAPVDGAWMGTSLLKKGLTPAAITLMGRQWALERGPYRAVTPSLLGSAADATKPPPQIYRRQTDYAERTALTTAPDLERAKKWQDELRSTTHLMIDVYNKNQLWPANFFAVKSGL